MSTATSSLSKPVSSCSCLELAPKVLKKNASLSEHLSHLQERVADLYNQAIQDFSQWLYYRGYVIPSYLSASLLGEPVASIKSGIKRDFQDWRPMLKKYGIFDASDPASLASLKTTLEQDKASTHCRPVLLFHGTLSKPSAFADWAEELQKAVQAKKIGPVITLQLPNNLEERMKLVYETIDKVCGLCEASWDEKDVKVDLLGHSLGGYAAHLAQIKPEHIQIKDEKGVVRRWHSIDPVHRNPRVGKVVSVAAPVWLCCKGQKDETTKGLKHEDIYPLKVVVEKNVEAAFTSEQLVAIRNNHPDLLDLVPTQDAISPIVSPLLPEQVKYVKHKHVGVMQCVKVCKIAIDFISSKG